MEKVSINDCNVGAFRRDASDGTRQWVYDGYVDTNGTAWPGGWYLITPTGFSGPRTDWIPGESGSVYGTKGSGYAGLTVDSAGYVQYPSDVEVFDTGEPSKKGARKGFRPKSSSSASSGGTNQAASGGTNYDGETVTIGGGAMKLNVKNLISAFFRGQKYQAYSLYLFTTTGSPYGVIQDGSAWDTIKLGADAISAAGGEATAAELTDTQDYAAALAVEGSARLLYQSQVMQLEKWEAWACDAISQDWISLAIDFLMGGGLSMLSGGLGVSMLGAPQMAAAPQVRVQARRQVAGKLTLEELAAALVKAGAIPADAVKLTRK